MKFSENWLRELVEIKADRAELAHALTMAGLEVEELTPLGDDLAGVVVAEIIAAEKHPEADRLQVCQVNAGPGEPLPEAQAFAFEAQIRPSKKPIWAFESSHER